MKHRFGSNCLPLLVGTVVMAGVMIALLPGTGPSVVEGAKPAAPSIVNRLYFPLVLKPAPGISGRVTFNGAPIAGVPLLLRFYDGSAYSTLATATTAADGSYVFSGVPTLSAGQKYYVRFQNSTSGPSSELWYWGTRTLLSYSAVDSVSIGDFDIANINLVSPPHGATVALPYAFQWTARPANPSDSYEFDLEGATGSPYWYTNPPLGYVSSYTLNALPAGFSPNVQYRWYMMVTDSKGGWGTSYYYQNVTFSNSGRYMSAPDGGVPARDPEYADMGRHD